MAKSIVVISDTQIPYEDKKAVKALLDFIGAYQPDEVVHIGDVMDYPQPSRWNKDTKAEFEGSIFKDSEYAIKNFITPLREAYSGPIKFLEGNHDLRPRAYLEKYAPALASEAFNFEKLLRFEEFEIERAPDFYSFAPGWVMMHGHLGVKTISAIAGNTALIAAKRMGVSVIMGHTHRLGKASYSQGYDGKVYRTLTGMEVGNLMDMKRAEYLKGAAGDWQTGFGLVHVSGDVVQATPVSMHRRRFIVDGVIYA